MKKQNHIATDVGRAKKLSVDLQVALNKFVPFIEDKCSPGRCHVKVQTVWWMDKLDIDHLADVISGDGIKLVANENGNKLLFWYEQDTTMPESILNSVRYAH